MMRGAALVVNQMVNPAAPFKRNCAPIAAQNRDMIPTFKQSSNQTTQ